MPSSRPRPGVVVGAPEVRLAAAVLEQDLLGVGVHLVAHGGDAAGDVDHDLDHVLEVESHEAPQLGRGQASVAHNHDPRRGHRRIACSRKPSTADAVVPATVSRTSTVTV